MSTSPVDPQDVRAAAEVHRELGPEYDDAVIAAFIDRVDRAVEARVEARLAEELERQPAARNRNRRTLLKGVALGVGASALVVGVGLSHAHVGIHRQVGPQVVFPVPGPGPRHAIFVPGPGGKPGIKVIKPGAPPPPPAAT
jgi:hypothetical protein